MNEEMEKMQQENYARMLASNMERLSKEEVNTLRKLGLSHEEIAELSPGHNPFKDGGLAKNRDFTALMEAQ